MRESQSSHFAMLRAYEADGSSAVVLVGEIDLASTTPLEQTVDALLDEHADRVDLDLGAVVFLDSFGLSALERFQERLRAGGVQSCVRHASAPVHRIVDLVDSPLLAVR